MRISRRVFNGDGQAIDRKQGEPILGRVLLNILTAANEAAVSRQAMAAIFGFSGAREAQSVTAWP